ncbi:MAG: hypothetical protein ACPF97_08015, partial [Ilumatobacteraceae bacterium]
MFEDGCDTDLSIDAFTLPPALLDAPHLVDSPTINVIGSFDVDTSQLVASMHKIAFPLNSSGAGMGNLHEVLTDLQKAKLDHVRRGHCSLKRAGISSCHSKGGFKLTKEAVAQLAVDGCDVCNAYRIKLTDPKSKPVDEGGDEAAGPIHTIVYDQFGMVATPSAGYGYHYAHIYASPKKNVAWLLGSKRNDAATIADLWKQMEASFALWFPDEKCVVLRMDSYSSNMSNLMLKALLDGMTNPQFSPPGQHALLSDAERYWYPLVVRALITMRHAGAPESMWYDALLHALDVENTLATRICEKKSSHISGYERALGHAPDVSDIYAFYAPARFAIDKAQLNGKWVERACAGFWVGRDINFVMQGKHGYGRFWDGYKHRTVHMRFFVQEGKFLDLNAPNNKKLPDFPSDSDPIATAVRRPANSPVTITAGVDDLAALDPSAPPPPTASAAPQSLPLSVTKPARSVPVQKYDNDTRYDALFSLSDVAICDECDA